MRLPLVHLLAKSPFPKAVNLMGASVTCVQMLPSLTEALIAGDQNTVAKLARQTSQLERAADEIRHQAVADLPTRLLLPVDRRDVLRLLSEIDSMADCVEDIGVLLTLRPLTVPAKLVQSLRDFVSGVLKAVDAAESLVARLEELVRAGFSGPSANETLAHVEELSRLEHVADKLQDQCAKLLFRCEDEMPPVALFMWTKVLQKIGSIANHAEAIGDQFRLFVAR